MYTLTKIRSRFFLILRVLGMGIIVLVAALLFYSEMFEPAIQTEWSFKTVMWSMVNVLKFLGVTTLTLFLFYMSISLATPGAETGGKCPSTRYFVILAIYGVAYLVTLHKLFGAGP